MMSCKLSHIFASQSSEFQLFLQSNQERFGHHLSLALATTLANMHANAVQVQNISRLCGPLFVCRRWLLVTSAAAANIGKRGL